MYHLLNFCVFRHVLTYLRIASIRIILILNKIRHVWESYQIASKALWHVLTCLRIISNRIISIMTCLDMFVESYQIVSGYFLKNLESFARIHELNEPFTIKSQKSFFRVKSLKSIYERSWTQFFWVLFWKKLKTPKRHFEIN